MATLLCLVVTRWILTGENLRKRGIVGPSHCAMCANAEEIMDHLLDECTFIAQLCDRGVEFFRNSNRVCGLLDLSITKWLVNLFQNPFVNKVWQIILDSCYGKYGRKCTGVIFKTTTIQRMEL